MSTKTNILIGILSLVFAAAGLIYQIATREEPTLFSETDRFYCTLRPDTKRGGSVWTVIYRHDKGKQPWLNMVKSFGDGWNTQRRCDKIADRLEIFRQDGLTELTYRDDPNTPEQPVICAKTKISGDNCPLLVTLEQGADPYIALREMIEALEQGTAVDQFKGTTVDPSLTTVAPSNVPKFLAEFSPENPVIKLEVLLAKDDLK